MEEEVGGGLPDNPEGLSNSAESHVAEGTGESGADDGEQRQPSGDPRFAGKSPEELVAIINEQNRQIGRQGNALGEISALRQGLADVQNLIASGWRPQQDRYQPEQQQRSPEPEFDFSNPVPQVERIVHNVVGAYEQRRMAAEQARMMAEAQMNFAEGRDSVYSQHPELFQGIEREVEQAVGLAFLNKTITAAMLRSPKTWTLAANVLRMERGEGDKISIRRSVKPVDIEKPGRSSGRDEDEIVLTDEDRDEMRRLGFSEKEAKENIRYALKARAQGLQVDRRN